MLRRENVRTPLPRLLSRTNSVPKNPDKTSMACQLVLGRYVSTRERKFNPIPKVMYVRLFGIAVETGEHKHEDYYP